MKRVITATVLIPLVAWTVVWSPTWIFLLVMALVGAGAFWEFDTIAAAHGLTRSKWWGVAAGIAFLLAPEPAVPTLVVIAGVLIALQLGASDFSKVLPSVAATILGIVYIFGAWRCGILLREISPRMLMVPLLVSWAGDIAAMYVGKAWGKRKLAPEVSPGKTQEGALASIAAGALVTALYVYAIGSFMPLWTALLIGAITNAAGQIGDLCESVLKRGANMKDSGTMLPGHGGWLDRIDSTLFTIPVFYLAQQVDTWF